MEPAVGKRPAPIAVEGAAVVAVAAEGRTVTTIGTRTRRETPPVSEAVSRSLRRVAVGAATNRVRGILSPASTEISSWPAKERRMSMYNKYCS